MTDSRLVAVFGYSRGGQEELHEICAARVRQAEQEAGPGDVVLLSGWGRRQRVPSEAERMARAWNGACRRVFLDRRARSTLGNVIGAATLARTLNAEVLVVTSGWHARRAAALLRFALRGSGSTVRLAATVEPGTFGTRLRELASWTLVPLMMLAVTRAQPARHE